MVSFAALLYRRRRDSAGPPTVRRGGPFPALRTVVFVALRQLWRRKLLNSIAMGGVVLGVLVLVVMNGILGGLHQKFTEAILLISPHVIIHDTELRDEAPVLERFEKGPVVAQVADQGPTDRQARINHPTEIAHALRQIPGVIGAAASIAGTVLIEYGRESRGIDLRGIDVVEQEKVTPIGQFTIAGRLSALRTESNGIVIGSGVAQLMGLHVGDVVRASATYGQPLDLRVAAIYESGVPPVDKARCFTLLRNAQALLGRQDTISEIDVRLASPDRADWFASRFERMFPYDAESWQETNANFLSAFKLQDTVIGCVIAALLMVGGFGILAIQIMIVMEKRRDIAILRSFGLTQADILSMFLFQGFLIALTGSLIGDGIGKLVVYFLSKLKVHMEGGAYKSNTFLIVDNPRFYLYGVACALFVGMTAAFIPAWRAARVEPVDVLRGQTA